MELVSPAAFLTQFFRAPLTATQTPPLLTLSHPATLLSALFLVHYLNRAIISPLRTPSRSKSHLIVPLSAVVFNSVNGSLMGAYLSSGAASAIRTSPRFWFGIALWAVGFAGNIVHDEILLNLRRNANAQKKNDDGKAKGEHYAIPYGLLYRWISYPNYLCEWLEWLGFALAASPAPSVASVSAFIATMSPPWGFLWAEVLLMLPRAWKGHKWYHSKFPDYPKERKAVIPFVL